MARANAIKIQQGQPLGHIRDLTAQPRNARKHTARNIGDIVNALHEVGAARSIVIDERGVVLAGNGTIEAAAEAGITKMQVVDADGDTIIAVRRTGLTPQQKDRLALFDNRAAEHALWDTDVLLQLEAEGALAGMWTDDEVAAIKALQEPVTGLTDPDDVPALRATDIQAGDLFALGAHRLLCGDSTKAEDVAMVLAGTVPRLMVTDPPYGVENEGGSGNDRKRRRLAGDDTVALYDRVLSVSAMAPAAVLYMWHAGKYADVVYVAARAAGFDVRAQIIWNKINAHYGAFMAQYMPKHEPCMYAVRGSASWIGPTNEVTVWDIPQPSTNSLHPTEKPVECMSRPMKNHVAPEVYEPFCGSGTTLIAAEQLQRACYAIEIEPAYVQVAIDRWEAFTGHTAAKVGETVR